MLDDAEAGADIGLLRVGLALIASVSDEQDLTWLAVQPTTAMPAAREGDLARAGGIAAAAQAEFAARGFGWPFTVDRLKAVGNPDRPAHRSSRSSPDRGDQSN